MYESFYGLKEKPFTLLPDPDYLYLSPKHQRALTLLEYGMMNQAGFSVICGDTGAGKTTLIRRLLAELGDETKVGLITNTHQSFGELLNWVLMAFGLDGDGKSKAQMHQMFIDFLIEQYANNKHTVLIVDEAQNMGADTLEELRMLSNINADKDQVLQVILAGQPALRETLRKPELMQFAQRIAVDYYLESLSQEETQAYINHRLSVAGSQKNIFTADACAAIFKYSGGTPRLINLLCDTAMVYGFAEQSLIISEQLVHDVVREQHSNSIIPTFNTSQEDASSGHLAEEVKAQQPVVAKPPVEDAIEKDKANEANASLAQPTAHQTGSVVNGVNHAIPVSKSADIAASETIPAGRPAEAKDDSNVTPIKAKQADGSGSEPNTADNIDVHKADHAKKIHSEGRLETPEIQNKNETTGQTAKQEDSAPDNKQHEGFTDTIKSSLDDLPIDGDTQTVAPEKAKAERREEHADADRIHDRRHPDDDVYPIVHIEENPKKGLSVVLIALVGGMFVASVAMMVAAWFMFGGAGNNSQNNDQLINQQVQREVENRELKALEKERDAALAVTRALERERDAALQAAKAQEKIRAAELRAAEILAEQEQAATKRLQQARARTREAEKAESKALERERKLKRQAEKREVELEQKRLNLLREERKRLDELAAQERRLKQQQLNQQQLNSNKVEQHKPVEVKEVPVIQPKAETKVKPKKEESFSSNPCNSPSAKFLSTCKK